MYLLLMAITLELFQSNCKIYQLTEFSGCYIYYMHLRIDSLDISSNIISEHLWLSSDAIALHARPQVGLTLPTTTHQTIYARISYASEERWSAARH